MAKFRPYKRIKITSERTDGRPLEGTSLYSVHRQGEPGAVPGTFRRRTYRLFYSLRDATLAAFCRGKRMGKLEDDGNGVTVTLAKVEYARFQEPLVFRLDYSQLEQIRVLLHYHSEENWYREYIEELK